MCDKKTPKNVNPQDPQHGQISDRRRLVSGISKTIKQRSTTVGSGLCVDAFQSPRRCHISIKRASPETRGGGVKVIHSTMDHTCPGCHMLFSVGRQLYCRFLGHLSSVRIFEVQRRRQSRTPHSEKKKIFTRQLECVIWRDRSRRAS